MTCALFEPRVLGEFLRKADESFVSRPRACNERTDAKADALPPGDGSTRPSDTWPDANEAAGVRSRRTLLEVRQARQRSATRFAASDRGHRQRPLRISFGKHVR